MNKKIIHMVTVSNSIGLMKGQLNYLKKQGYEVIVVSSPGERLENIFNDEGVRGKSIPMSRTISPFNDLISLLRIITFFIQEKPDIVNAGTPKAGLLGMIAAWLIRTPFKVYTNRGLPFERSRGIKRKILKFTEKIACYCADKVICISPSVEKVLLKNNLTDKDKTVVFGLGSSNGLELSKYEHTDEIESTVKKIKKKYKLEDKFVIGNVGRINNFKGIIELVAAFENIQKNHKNIKLLLVGRMEEKDPIDPSTKYKILNNPDIIYVGYQHNPVPFYFAMDIFVFPTYMEGFGNTSIEAQATGIPVIATNATGVVDTIVDGKTGLLVNVKDVKSLACAIEKMLNNPLMIKNMGRIGKERVFNNFSNLYIWEHINELYKTSFK